MKLSVPAIIACGLSLLGCLSLQAAEPAASSFDAVAQKFFAQHCRACHAGEKPKGDFRIDRLSADFADKANREQWQKVLEQVEIGNMPPSTKPQPTDIEIQKLAEWINGRVAAAEKVHHDAQGRVVLRRLNRIEYTNTVRDLLGVDVDLKDLLPLDTGSSGFDNSAEALHTSAYLMENYLEAAERVLDAAIAGGPAPWKIQKRYDLKEEKSVKPTGSVYRHVDDGVAIFSSWVSANIQVALYSFQTRSRGPYRVRISGYGYQTKKPVTFHVLAGPTSSQIQQQLVDYFSVPADEPTVVEFTRQMEPGQTIRLVVDQLGAIPPDVTKVGADKYTGPGLVVQWIDVEGPLGDAWPPESHRRLFGDLKQIDAPTDQNPKRREVTSSQPLVDAERILRDFARRAFRRSVTEADIKPHLDRVDAKLKEGASFEAAMRVGLRGVLVSPHFLFLREKVAPPARALDDFALASRLSYFLWSSQPDETLLKVAEKGELRKPEVLRAQVERLLGDPKAAAFTENFVGQWLGLRAIDDTLPDRMLYPEFDDILKTSMTREVYLFFDEVLKHDLSLTNFTASDFTMLNGPLAKHYGIPDAAAGLGFKKVSLPPELHRGGVLTMAAVMKVTANGTTTSPILRGAWVLDRILGTPPPKPTVDVEAVEPDIRGATTIRAQLAKHRERAECASCHAQIDPPGFALENFDVIGGWRENYRSIGDGQPTMVNGRRVRYKLGPPVDASDLLPDGRAFKNIDDYKQLLLSDKDQLARALTEKLLAYATGAAPTTADRPAVEAIVARSREQNYGFRTLIHEIVQSETFRTK